MLYTVVTRATQLVVLVGSPRALAQAVRATGSRRRHTALVHRFKAALPSHLCPWRIGAITAAALVLLHREHDRTT